VLIPDSANAMGWHIGDHGFEMTLAATVPELLRQHVGPWTRACLERQSLEPAGVGAWAIHPGGPRVIESVLASIGLSEDRGHASLEVLRRFGNMSSATLLFILRDLWKANVPRPWMALAFGPGLVGESLLLR
jgi:predicted naringenin-chalcone synthase